MIWQFQECVPYWWPLYGPPHPLVADAYVVDHLLGHNCHHIVCATAKVLPDYNFFLSLGDINADDDSMPWWLLCLVAQLYWNFEDNSVDFLHVYYLNQYDLKV